MNFDCSLLTVMFDGARDSYIDLVSFNFSVGLTTQMLVYNNRTFLAHSGENNDKLQNN